MLLSTFCPAVDDLTASGRVLTRACGAGSRTTAPAAATMLGVCGGEGHLPALLPALSEQVGSLGEKCRRGARLSREGRWAVGLQGRELLPRNGQG